MTDIKIDPHVDLNPRYTTHKELEQYNVRFRINRLIDENRVLGKSNQKDFDVNNVQILITAQAFINQRPVTPEKTTRIIRKMFIEEDIELPIKIPNLSYNAIIAIKIWSLDNKYDENKPLASTIISLFDSDLKLREGKKYLLLWASCLPDTSIDSNTPGLVTDPNINDLNFYNTRLDAFERQLLDAGGSMSHPNALNNKCVQALRNQVFYAYRKVPAAFLEVEFPTFEVPVLYEDIDLRQESAIRDVPSAPGTGAMEYYYETSLFSNNIIFADHDQDNQQTDPVQEQYLLLLRFNDDARELKPRLEEVDFINKILMKPIFGILTQEERNIIWMYRYYLSANKDALSKFLQSVNWSLEKESKEALSLLDQWANIDYEDSLHLLSASFCANDLYNSRMRKPINKVIKIREYAVKVLGEVSNERLNFILLQLVQALRYEPLGEAGPLLSFLVKRACSDGKIAINLYWHLRVEVEINTGQLGTFYQFCLENFRDALVEAQDGGDVYEGIQEQSNFRDILKHLNSKIRVKRRVDDKKVELRKALKENVGNQVKPHPMTLEPTLVISGFNPDECTCFKSAMAPLLLSLNAQKTEAIFREKPKSDKFKYRVIFKNGDDLRQDQLILQIIALMDSLLKGVNIHLNLTPYRALATGKDDGYLEFVPDSDTVQEILKQNGESLISFFKKLAHKAIDNPESWYYKDRGDIDLARANDQGEKKKLEEKAYEKILENYIDSCAGYCVITYILGIGDRHLENLMINNEGKFFHIDFGFILGRDPKIQPPPIKISKEMVEAMGGNLSPNYEKFRKKCVVIYHYLRNYAKLVTNLFHLMIDSGLPHLDEKGLEKLWERFRLDESNEMAEKTILALIDESVDAFFGRVFDRWHEFVVTYWR